MRVFGMALLLVLVGSPLAQAGEWQDGPGFAPPPPQVVDPALGLPSPWRYIDSEGKANSPCLGDISTPSCLYDTMVACNAWRPARGEETKGAPGYAYGPDWERGLHPLCSPLLWTPIVGYDLLGNERVVYEMGSLLDWTGSTSIAYRLNAFRVSTAMLGEISRGDQNPFYAQPEDLILVPERIFCHSDIEKSWDWDALLRGNPSPDQVQSQLPAHCSYDSSPMLVRVRFNAERYWVVGTYRRDRAGYYWPPIVAFQRSIRK